MTFGPGNANMGVHYDNVEGMFMTNAYKNCPSTYARNQRNVWGSGGTAPCIFFDRHTNFNENVWYQCCKAVMKQATASSRQFFCALFGFGVKESGLEN
jgi:hypothetical protein